MLTTKKCATAKPGAKARRMSDRHGLMLVTQPSGSKSWIQRLSVQGRRRDLGLGGYPAVPLAVAREIAMRNWIAARDGRDPRPRIKAKPTFAKCAESYLKLRNGDLTRSVLQNWRTTLAYCTFADIAVDQVDADDVARTLRPLIEERPTVARKLQQRIATVMDHSIAKGWRNENPCAALAARLPKSAHRTRNHASIAHGGLGAVLRDIEASTRVALHTRLAIKFCALTAARSGEVRGATWKEIDLEAATWTIPGERTKRRKQHVVPLSSAARAVLAEAAADGRNGHLVFPASGAKPIDPSSLSSPLKRRGAGTTHGLRSAFRSWAIETGVRREVAELCLAHEIGLNQAEAAYLHSDLVEQRREVMDTWGDYLTG